MIRRLARTWATGCLTLAALALHALPAAFAFAQYRRSLVLHGEVWRVWTGHLVHFNLSHLLWNLAIFVPAGVWLESWRPTVTRWLYLIAPVFISALLVLADPELERYAGLSGLAAGMLVLLSVLQLRAGQPAGFWYAVLALVAAKIGWELHTGSTLLVASGADIRSVPLAHLGGVTVGGVLGLVASRTPPHRKPNAGSRPAG